MTLEKQRVEREVEELRKDLQQEQIDNEAHVSELEEQLRNGRALLTRKQDQGVSS